MESDFAYFNRRADEERIAATHASHPRARESHLELAGRYEDLATAIAARDRQLGLGPLNVPLTV